MAHMYEGIFRICSRHIFYILHELVLIEMRDAYSIRKPRWWFLCAECMYASARKNVAGTGRRITSCGALFINAIIQGYEGREAFDMIYQ